MRGKYFANLVLIGFLPLLLVAGGAYYTFLNQAPSASPVAVGSVDSNLQAVQTRLSAISSSLVSSVQKCYSDIVTLAAGPTDEACQNFLSSHVGVSAVFMLAEDGRVEKIFPAGSTVVDAAYGSSDEFKNMKERLFTDGRNPYQFFTDRLGYSAFVFTSPTPGKSVLGAVLNLESFFTGLDLKGGEAFLLEPTSGRYFVHTNKAKQKDTFNAGQEPWLVKVQDDLKNKQAGRQVNGTESAVAYHPLGIQLFGLVQQMPYASLAPPPPPKKDLQARLQELLLTPLTLSLVVALAWILLVGSLRMKSFLKPMQDALAVVQRAGGGGAAITEADVKAVGADEPGKLLAAAAQWAQRLEGERDQKVKEIDDELRRTKSNLTINLEGKAKELGTAAQQLTNFKTQLETANQTLADKMKELEAMKGMTDGLRSQTEQAKAEISKLKTQMGSHEEKAGSLQARLTEADAKLKDMEGKLLRAVSASSAIQVSQVRVAAIRTMAEELKTTLGIIKGYVSSALGSAQGGITEKQQEFLGMVINRSARLEKFINDLMDIYLVEIEQEGAVREDINLASEIEGLAFNYQPQADIKGLKIKVEAKPGVPKIPVVRRRFTQLWNILYLQMIKDAPRSTTLSIQVEPLGEDAKVTVHDPGLTVKDEHLSKLFDEFYDPKHPASPQLAGTGLKLALVKTILAAHGGGAVAEKANPGTLLILTFPSKVKKKGEVPVPAPASIPAPAKPAAPPLAPATPTPTASPAPAGAAPGVKIPAFGLGANAPKPAPAPSAAAAGALDAMMKKGIIAPPTGAPAAPLGGPSTPMPTTPTAPAPAPKPPAAPAPTPASAPGSVAGSLDSLIGKTSAPPVPTAPAPMPKPATSAPSAPSAPAPVAPVAPKAPTAPIAIGGLDALLAAMPAPSEPKAPTPAPPPPSAPPKPAGAPTPTPPPPPAPGMVKPPVPPAPAPGAPPAGAPKVVQTALKATPPPSSILDMDNQDGFKLDDSGAPAKPPAPAAPKPVVPPPPPAVKPPMPGMPPAGVPKPPITGAPPAGAPKPPAPPPGAPPAGGPIVKDLNKENSSDGELID